MFDVGRRGKVALVALTVSLLGSSMLVVTAAAPSALAENNGVGAKPAMGWSTWSSLSTDPTQAKVEAEADAMKSSGLATVGYDYVNVDDDWYQCPGSQGPNVDANGRWVIDTTKFPNSGSTNGIAAVAAHVHADGLKFGLYITPGVSEQAVVAKSKILGTSDTVDQIATGSKENNYNCKGMVGIDYSKAGAQTFIDSWADELASWGVDYIKMDGVGASDIADLKAWSAALQQTGRPIHLELSNSLAIADASTWQEYSNGWRVGPDIECYCSTLTNWGHIVRVFGQVGSWQPYGGPGGFNDYDSIEVGNGSHDGLTTAERQTQLGLWAMASSPMILGTDLTDLDPTDLGYLKNTAVIGVDQDSIDAKEIVNSGNEQVYAKTESNGDVILGLFDSSDSAGQTDTVSLSAAGLSGSATATNLWTGASAGTVSGTYSVTLGAGASQLLRLVPKSGAGTAYTIVNRESGLCLDVTGASKVAGAAIEQWTCNGGTNQEWRQTGSTLVSVNSGLCLDVPGSSDANGTVLDQAACSGGSNQSFTQSSSGAYTYFTAVNSGLRVEVFAASKTAGAAVDQWPADGTQNQQWTVAAVG